MTAVVATTRFGPDSYTVTPAGFVDGGMLVEPDPGNAGTIRPASVASSSFLGVALQPAEGASYANPVTSGYGASVLDISVPVDRAAVAWQGTFKMTYNAAASFGQLLAAGPNGTVQPWSSAGSSGSAPTDGVTYGPKTTVADGVTTAGSLTVTSATAAFVAGDLYRPISGGTLPSGTIITAVVNGTTVTVSQAPLMNATGVSLVFGNSPIVTSASSTFTAAVEGASISGGSIPASTIITQVIDTHTVRLSNAPTAAASGVTVTIGAQTAELSNQVVGRCVEPNGVLAGSVGKVRLAGI